MALMSGPSPTCTCNGCPKCRRRIAAKRRYHGGTYTTPLAAGRFQPSRLNLPTDEAVLAYVAGLFDGEGCITRQSNCVRLQLAMTDESVIRWLGEIGGTVKERRVAGNRRPCWVWLVMRQTEVWEVLLAVQPFLRVKASQARRALDDIAERAAARRLVGIAERSYAREWPE
jgi:hypothetical protein